MLKDNYLNELIEHHRRDGNRNNASQIHEKDICLFKIDNMKQSSWPIATVTKCIQSRDGHIRQVELRDSKGRCYKRPINHLVPLLNAKQEEYT